MSASTSAVSKAVPGTTPWPAYALGAAALLVAYAGTALWYTHGALSLPLDDPFIYLQYARQTAAGLPFQYNAGDAPTLGTTSALFALMLVPAFWVGLDGVAMVPCLWALGTGLLAGCAGLMHQLGERWLGSGFGRWAGAATLLCGPVVWGSFSGMETPLFAFALLWLLERSDRVLSGELSATRWIAPAALTMLARPEGLGPVALAAGVLVASRWFARTERGAQPSSGELPLDVSAGRADTAPGLMVGSLVAPFAIALLPGIWLALLGGSFAPSGAAAKSLLANEPFEAPEVLRQMLMSASEILKAIFAGSLGQPGGRQFAYDMNARAMFFAPLTFALFVFGVAPAIAAEWQRRAPGRATLLGGSFLLVLLTTSLLREPDAHFNRYQMPIMPLFLLGAVAGAARAGAWAKRAIGGASANALAPGLLGFLLLFGFSSTLAFAVHYGDNAADVEAMHMQLAQVIDDSLPPDARVAVNDAGVLRYLGGRRTLDLVGLTSPGMAEIGRSGPGSLVEYLESLPAPERPGYFAVFPSWFGLPGDILRPLHGVRLRSNSIAPPEKVLYEARWNALRASDGPCDAGLLPAGYRVVDGVDFADLADERRHAVRVRSRERGERPRAAALLARCAGDTDAFLEGARGVTGSVSAAFDVEPGRAAAVLLRVPNVRQRVWLAWDRQALDPVAIDGSGDPGAWVEVAVPIPPEALRATRGRLSLEATSGGSFVVAHAWVAQLR